MQRFTAVSPSGYRVESTAASIDEAAADLEARGYEVLDFASASEIVIAD